jgi:hypothetical protein
LDIPKFPLKITLLDKYGPAMNVSDKSEADAYLEGCVQHSMAHGYSRKDAVRLEKANLGYFAGYYSHEIRAKVEDLYDTAHPIFGKIAVNGPPTLEEALQKGIELGRKLKQRDRDE